MSLTRLARRRGFSCRHRYAVKGWTSEKNREFFGACFTPHGHGHNYELEVFLEGPVDPITGMIVNLVAVDRWIEGVLKPLHGANLNDLEAFREKVPTTEVLACYLNECLRQALPFPAVQLVKIRLYEYEDLWVDVWSS